MVRIIQYGSSANCAKHSSYDKLKELTKHPINTWKNTVEKMNSVNIISWIIEAASW